MFCCCICSGLFFFFFLAESWKGQLFNARTESFREMNRVLYLCFSVAGYHASCAGSEVLVFICHCISGKTSPVSLSEKHVAYFIFLFSLGNVKYNENLLFFTPIYAI